MNGYISRKDRICNHRWQTPTQNDFFQISLNKQVSQTGLFIVELTPLILFSCDHLSFAESFTLVLAIWGIAYGSLNCSI